MANNYYTPGSDSEMDYLMQMRREVAHIISAGKAMGRNKPMTLFLETHFPFFDKEVQRILRERHPATYLPSMNASSYAIDAYLLAEQYAWLAKDDSPLKDCGFLQNQTSYYFANDLRWFPRLLTAVTESVEAIYHFAPESSSRKMSLQNWIHTFLNSSDSPASTWLENTEFMNNAMIRTKWRSPEQVKNSIRVSASKLNGKRRRIFTEWAPAWDAELRYLDRLLWEWPHVRALTKTLSKG